MQLLRDGDQKINDVCRRLRSCLIKSEKLVLFVLSLFPPAVFIFMQFLLDQNKRVQCPSMYMPVGEGASIFSAVAYFRSGFSDRFENALSIRFSRKQLASKNAQMGRGSKRHRWLFFLLGFFWRFAHFFFLLCLVEWTFSGGMIQKKPCFEWKDSDVFCWKAVQLIADGRKRQSSAGCNARYFIFIVVPASRGCVKGDWVWTSNH